MATLSYAESGVDRELADRFVEKIGILSKSTLNRKVKSSVGGYASLYELDKKDYKDIHNTALGQQHLTDLIHEFLKNKRYVLSCVVLSTVEL